MTVHHGRHEMPPMARWRAFWGGPCGTPALCMCMVILFVAVMAFVESLMPEAHAEEKPMPTLVPVAAVLRNTGTGWQVLNNAGHQPVHITSVEDKGTYLQVNFDQTFTQVGAIVIAPDEQFAKTGHRAGASVGYAYMNVYMFTHGGTPVNPANLVSPIGNWWVTGHMWAAS